MTSSERRRDARIAVDRPIKLQCVHSGRYLRGHTGNLSASGALLEIDHPSLLVRGQRLRIGIAWDNRQAVISSDAMAQATVVRSWGQGPTQRVAVRFDHRQELAATG